MQKRPISSKEKDEKRRKNEKKTGERIRQLKNCAMSNTKGEVKQKRNGAAARKPEARGVGYGCALGYYLIRKAPSAKGKKGSFHVTHC